MVFVVTFVGFFVYNKHLESLESAACVYCQEKGRSLGPGFTALLLLLELEFIVVSRQAATTVGSRAWLEKVPTPVSGPAIAWTDPKEKDIKDGKEEICFQGEGPVGNREIASARPTEWTDGVIHPADKPTETTRENDKEIPGRTRTAWKKMRWKHNIDLDAGLKPLVAWKMGRMAELRKEVEKRIAKIRLHNRSLWVRYVRHPMECALKEAEVGKDTAYAPIVDPIMDTQRKLLRKRARKEARKKIIFGHIAAEENTGFWPNLGNLPTFLGRSVADGVKSSRSDL